MRSIRGSTRNFNKPHNISLIGYKKTLSFLFVARRRFALRRRRARLLRTRLNFVELRLLGALFCRLFRRHSGERLKEAVDAALLRLVSRRFEALEATRNAFIAEICARVHVATHSFRARARLTYAKLFSVTRIRQISSIFGSDQTS